MQLCQRAVNGQVSTGWLLAFDAYFDAEDDLILIYNFA